MMNTTGLMTWMNIWKNWSGEKPPWKSYTIISEMLENLMKINLNLAANKIINQSFTKNLNL